MAAHQIVVSASCYLLCSKHIVLRNVCLIGLLNQTFLRAEVYLTISLLQCPHLIQRPLWNICWVQPSIIQPTAPHFLHLHRTVPHFRVPFPPRCFGLIPKQCSDIVFLLYLTVSQTTIARDGWLYIKHVSHNHPRWGVVENSPFRLFFPTSFLCVIALLSQKNVAL